MLKRAGGELAFVTNLLPPAVGLIQWEDGFEHAALVSGAGGGTVRGWEGLGEGGLSCVLEGSTAPAIARPDFLV